MSKIMRFPSTRVLQAFQMIAECASFTKAADRLCVTQGAVSQYVRSLEQELGQPLFVRGHRTVELTPAGKIYLEHTNTALASLASGAAALAQDSNDSILTISVSPNFASKWLVHRLNSFMLARPELELRISIAMQHIDFATSDVDGAIRHGNGHWKQLGVTKLCDEQIFAVCSPDYLQASHDLGKPDLRQPKDLRGHDILNDRSRDDWPEWCRLSGLEFSDLKIRSQFDQTSAVIDAAVASNGIALVRSALATNDLLEGRLVRLFKTAMPAPFGYYFVHPRSSAKVLKIVRFRKWLLEEMAVDAERIESQINVR